MAYKQTIKTTLYNFIKKTSKMLPVILTKISFMSKPASLKK